jgi:hypothetical protein
MLHKTIWISFTEIQQEWNFTDRKGFEHIHMQKSEFHSVPGRSNLCTKHHYESERGAIMCNQGNNYRLCIRDYGMVRVSKENKCFCLV